MNKRSNESTMRPNLDRGVMERRDFLKGLGVALAGMLIAGGSGLAFADTQPCVGGVETRTSVTTTLTPVGPTGTRTVKSRSKTYTGGTTHSGISKTGTKTYTTIVKRSASRQGQPPTRTSYMYTRQVDQTCDHTKTKYNYTRTWPAGVVTVTPNTVVTGLSTYTVTCSVVEEQSDEQARLFPVPKSIDELRGRGERCDLV